MQTFLIILGIYVIGFILVLLFTYPFNPGIIEKDSIMLKQQKDRSKKLACGWPYWFITGVLMGFAKSEE